MSLGSNPTIPEILDEVDEALPYTFPGPKLQWMTGSNGIILPTDFVNGTGRIRILDTQVITSPGSNIYFTGLDCAETTDARMLVAVIGAIGTSGSAIGVPAQPQVNEIGATADADWRTNGSGHSVVTCVSALNDTTTLGANGTARLRTSGATIAAAGIFWLGVYDTEQTSPTDRQTAGSTANVTTRGTNFTYGARGQCISGCMKYNSADTTVTNLTKRGTLAVGSGLLTLAFDTLQAAGSGNVTYSWTGGAVATCVAQSRSNA